MAVEENRSIGGIRVITGNLDDVLQRDRLAGAGYRHQHRLDIGHVVERARGFDDDVLAIGVDLASGENDVLRPQGIDSPGQVVRATEGRPMPAECFGDDPDRCRIHRSCRLKGVLKEATDAFYAVLDGYTLADLVRNRVALATILDLR